MLVTVGYRRRVKELRAIFAGAEEIADLGQFTRAERTRLQWALKHRLVGAVKKPWPGPLVGTCMKTWFVRVGF